MGPTVSGLNAKEDRYCLKCFQQTAFLRIDVRIRCSHLLSGKYSTPDQVCPPHGIKAQLPG